MAADFHLAIQGTSFGSVIFADTNRFYSWQKVSIHQYKYLICGIIRYANEVAIWKLGSIVCSNRLAEQDPMQTT